jgi:drug/metabolite transporter (DMT)-like permease
LEKENLKKGIIFGLMGTIIGSFNPIIANSRPMIIDAYLFAAMTVIVQALFFFPLMMVERKKLKSDFENKIITLDKMDAFLNGYKKNVPLLIFAGISFGVCFILFYIGYELAGAINGNLILKTTIFFSLFFDWFILHEKISIRQVIFSIILFFGLFLAVTQGSFAILELNLGIIVLFSVAGIWMFTHAISKPMLDRKQITSIHLVCIRNIISSLFLISTYFLFFPFENIQLLLNSITVFWGVLMGTIYGIGLYMWYKTLENINVSKATIITSGNLIFTAFFASLFLSEIFTVFHLMGTILIIISIFLIVNPMKNGKST